MKVERRLLELQVLTLTVLYQMVPLTVRVFKIQQYTKIDIPNSVKVALGIGHWALRIRKLLFGGHSSKALQCVPYAQMPNAQLPMTNCQSNLY